MRRNRERDNMPSDNALPEAPLDLAGLRGWVGGECLGRASIVGYAAQPREGWDEQFAVMAQRGDDRLLDPRLMGNEWDESWEW